MRALSQMTAPAKVTAVYDYKDEGGALLFQVLRFEPKSFRQRRPDGHGGWVWSLDGVRRVVYRLPELIAAPLDALIFICEGEKSADRLHSLGLAATCSPGGAGKWRPEFAEFFRGRDVVVLPDNDGPGLVHAEEVAQNLSTVARRVRVVWLATREHGDISDWLDAGHTAAELVERVAATPVYQPEGASEGPELLRAVENFLTEFIVLPRHTALPLALWVLTTHIYDLFDVFPYLSVSSPTPRCGKTRLLEVVGLLVSNPVRTSNISEAALYRVIEATHPTLLLDEAETLRGKGERADYLRGLLNAGNRRDACVTRCVGASFEVRKFSVFGPKVLAGIGQLPATIRDRSILIEMQRRRSAERVGRFLFRRAQPEAAKLAEKISAFMSGARRLVEAAYSSLEIGFLEDRDAEAWEPLFAVLTAADPARFEELKACSVSLTKLKGAGETEESLNLQLLADISRIWSPEADGMHTVDLINALKGVEAGPWREDVELTPRKLARFLRPFGIRSEQLWVGGVNLNGYRREALEPVIIRYLGPKTLEGLDPA